jgi:hypothetical protein
LQYPDPAIDKRIYRIHLAIHSEDGTSYAPIIVIPGTKRTPKTLPRKVKGKTYKLVNNNTFSFIFQFAKELK